MNNDLKNTPNLFRKNNGFTSQLLSRYGLLYLTTDETTINFHKANDVATSLERMLEEHHPKILVLNMATIENLDSSGIGALVHIYSESKRIGCEFYLLSITNHIDKILTLVTLKDIFNIVETLEEILGIPVIEE